MYQDNKIRCFNGISLLTSGNMNVIDLLTVYQTWASRGHDSSFANESNSMWSFMTILHSFNLLTYTKVNTPSFLLSLNTLVYFFYWHVQ